MVTLFCTSHHILSPNQRLFYDYVPKEYVILTIYWLGLIVPKKRPHLLQAKTSWIPFIASHSFFDQKDSQLQPKITAQKWTLIFKTLMCLTHASSQNISHYLFLTMFQIISQKGRRKVPHFIFQYLITLPPGCYKEAKEIQFKNRDMIFDNE